VSFITWTYALFLAGSFAAYWACPPRVRPPLLLALGVVFFAYGDVKGLIIATLATAVTYFVSERVAPGREEARRWLVLGIALLVGLLSFYKYGALFVELLRLLGIRSVSLDARIAAVPSPPLGISFFVFLLIHYLIEVHRGRFAPARPRDLSLFVLFFPTIVSGPLKRFESFAPQLDAGKRLSPDDVHVGLERLLFGLVKKTAADNLAPYSTFAFANPDGATWAGLWIAVYAYSLQIYFDFAGYSDMAIGSARLLGFSVPENFDYPYLQRNIARFWRRWHMTLTGWITEYVYIPLGGNRSGELRAALNRLIAMALCGLWHGPALHFAVWGLYHGALLNVHRAYLRWRGPEAVRAARAPQGDGSTLGTAAATLLTFHAVAIGWVFFACDFAVATMILARLLVPWR
jgi:alginate O-acetyltransferase complex protein AlgI